MATINTTFFFARNVDCVSGFGMEMDDAFLEEWRAELVSSDIVEGTSEPTLLTKQSISGQEPIHVLDMASFLGDITSSFAIDASHCLVGIRSVGCTAAYRGYRYVDLINITSSTVKVEVWFSDITNEKWHTDARLLLIDSASLVYMGDPVDDENKVPVGQSFIVSVELTEQRHQGQQEPPTVPVTVNAYHIPDISSIAAFGMPTADAAQQLFGILEGNPNMRTMYEVVLSSGHPAYFASVTYQKQWGDSSVDVHDILNELLSQGSDADFATALALNWGDDGTFDVGSYSNGFITFGSNALSNNSDHFDSEPIELLFHSVGY